MRALKAVGVEPVEVRRSSHLKGLEGIILPGGESTTFHIVLSEDDLGEKLVERLREGLPAWGTCAGAIMLGRGEGVPPRWGLIGVEVVRNSYGRQIDSFVTPLEVKGFDHLFDAVFIRAPRFTDLEDSVEVLARHAGEPVMARASSTLVTSFHPELTNDLRIHDYFIRNLCGRTSGNGRGRSTQ